VGRCNHQLAETRHAISPRPLLTAFRVGRTRKPFWVETGNRLDFAGLIDGRFLRVVNDENLDQRFCGYELESELFLDKREDRGPIGL
jgi:hypothetical protein